MNPPSCALPNRRTALRVLTAGAAATVVPALLGCETAPTGRRYRTATGSSDRIVMVIRHGEKPGKSGTAPAGIDLRGAVDTHSLTERGWTRAAYLADLFGPQSPAGLPTPTVIYASGNGRGSGEGTRPRETVGPLAAALNLPIDTTFSRGQETALATDAAQQAGPVLICWQHESIPAIGAAFAPEPNPPGVWPDDRYDLIWLFTADTDGWRFQQLDQRLLPGDATPTSY